MEKQNFSALVGGALSVYLHKTQTTAIRGSHCRKRAFSSANLRHACIYYFFQSRGTQLSAQQNYLQSFPQMVPLSGTPFPGSLTLLSEKGPELQGWDQSEAREALTLRFSREPSSFKSMGDVLFIMDF